MYQPVIIEKGQIRKDRSKLWGSGPQISVAKLEYQIPICFRSNLAGYVPIKSAYPSRATAFPSGFGRVKGLITHYPAPVEDILGLIWPVTYKALMKIPNIIDRMSNNYIVFQDGVANAYGLPNYQQELPHANDLVEGNVSLVQSNGVYLTTHQHSVSAEPVNFDQAMAQQYFAMLQQLNELQVQQEGSVLTYPAATRVPCRIVSGGLPCEELIGVTKREVSRHLRKRHGVKSASRGVTCTWNGGCAAPPMRGDSFPRHVGSKHLGTGKVRCGRCWKMYARKDAFKSHLVNGIQCDGTQLEVPMV
ncbi:hypothetical protein BJ138DRAFT_1163584 [Hygrophoropsis aurantiaca]|uniref:Uncharacterized protein n=1 Tax=Hygrophoropsis aurantiaca TaxID=72124 RepID=A0ACB7ZY56_9AGAM|nr:hypothetical protein BJ138DRAFT_1163584 [Hygrophoropsis aurantiaca]